MSDQSFTEQFLTRLTTGVTDAKQRSRQVFQKFLTQNQTATFDPAQPTALQFLERYHCILFPQQTAFAPIPDTNIFPLKVRTTELILKQVQIYYLPNRLESLLHHCDPFSAIATFLNALNFSYETLINNTSSRQLCQEIFKELMAIDQVYSVDTIPINEFPLYESAAKHKIEAFQKTAFAFTRALDIIAILDEVQPRNYEKQKYRICQFWHQQSLSELEKLIEKLSS